MIAAVLILALAALATVLLVSEWWSKGRAEFDQRMRDDLASIDFERWERGL